MIQKPMKTAFQQISPVKYQQTTGNLFTRALNRRPSRQFEAAFIQMHPSVPIKTAPLSPIVKGLIPAAPKIDYTCDQTFINKKNSEDNSLFCRQTLATNDTNLFCDQQLKIGPSEKTQVKIKSKNNQQPLQANYHTQPQTIKQQTIPIVQIQYQKILQKTAVILQNYEQDKRQKQFKNRQLQTHNKQLETQNRSLKQKIRYYERIVVNKV